MLEALAAGLPVVATDVGGNGEVLEKGRLGKLVPAREPQPLANAIAEVLSGLEAAKQQSHAHALQTRERYNIDRLVETYLEIYCMAKESCESKYMISILSIDMINRTLKQICGTSKKCAQGLLFSDLSRAAPHC